MTRTIAVPAILVGLALSVPATVVPSAAQQRVEAGRLDCLIEGGPGFVIGSSKELSCTFVPADASRPAEAYFGVVNKYGLDVGVTDAAVMQWLVFGPTAGLEEGALAGDYVGASAEVTAALGAGANVLVGGTGDTLVLQPISLQAQTGLNVAVGVSEFQLRSAAN